MFPAPNLPNVEVDGEYHVQPGALFVKGDLQWKGDLKAGQPVEFTAVIKFQEAGDWHVYASGDSPAREIIQKGIYGEDIYLHIAPDLSSYGWEKRAR